MEAGERAGRSRSLLRNIVESVLAAALLVTFVVSGVAISGESMEPTLSDGERALVPRYQTWLHRLGVGEFGRGDIVYFPSPEQEPGAICPWFCTHLIKRIVAVGGDTVALRNGQLILNGVPVHEPYLEETWHGSFTMPEMVVPEGHVFVLGDNRGPYGSFDSRVFGPIDRSRLEGRAAWVVWPLLRRDADGDWRWNVRPLHSPDYEPTGPTGRSGACLPDPGYFSLAASRPSSSSTSARACIASSTNCTCSHSSTPSSSAPRFTSSRLTPRANALSLNFFLRLLTV